jgi:hypothetical protein
LRELIKAEPQTDDELLDAIAEAIKGETERAEKMAELKRSVEVSALSAGERNDFQLGGRKEGLFARMEDMRLKHESELGSLRAELSEIKTIFKSGFSNLSAMAAAPQGNAAISQTPSFGVPALNHFPSSQHLSSSFVPPSANVAAILNPNAPGYSATVPSSAAQQPYVIPMRRFTGCQTCVSQNNPRCTHCFFCAEGGHRMAACPKYQELLLRNNVLPNGQQTGLTPNGTNGLPQGQANGMVNNGSPGNC